MQEYCPECAKNGQQIKIKTFQLNFQEAVFMCSSKACTWPVGRQELTFIDRPVGKEYSNTWEKSAHKHFKSNQDHLLEFPYTPPQTPAAFPDIIPTSADDIVCLSSSQADITNPNKPLDLLLNNTNNKTNSKPKLISVEIVSNDATSIADNSVFIKTGKLTLGPPIIKQVKIKSKDSSKVLSHTRKIGSSYKRFNLNDLSKKLSTHVNKKSKVKIDELEKVKVKAQDYLDKHNTTVKNVNNDNTNLSNVDIITNYKHNDVNLLNLDTIVKNEQNDNINISNVDTILKNEQSDNIHSSDLDSVIVDLSKNNNSIDFDSILTLTNSKDSDMELIDNTELDFNLDEFWDSLSNEINSTLKSGMENSDEFKWINSLFSS